MSLNKYLHSRTHKGARRATDVEPEREQRPLHLRIWAVLKYTFQEYNNDKIGVYGAALAFFAIFALPPLLVLLVSMLGWFIDPNTVQLQILGQIRAAGGAGSAEVVRTILENARRPDSSNSFALLFSVGMLIFSATGVFVQLQDALDTAWGVRPNPKAGWKLLLQSRALSFGLIGCLGFLVVVLLLADLALAVIENAVGARMGILQELQAFKLASLGISFLLLTGILAVVFKVLPDVKVRWQDVLAGSLFTALLLSLSKYAISWYLGSNDMGSAYGAAGSMIVFLFWLYLNIQLFLLGAEFTEAYAHEFGRPIRPDRHAIWLPGKPDQAPSTEMKVDEKVAEDEAKTPSPPTA